ncbi:Aquaglycerol porin AQY3 [Pseudozyma hubeiensis]|nr:Aquaglycerol porin AQY3 [Pseudozyma hubeiensis]
MRSRASSIGAGGSRRSSFAAAEPPTSTAADVAVPIELNLPHKGSATSSANNSQIDLTGHHIYLPDNAAGTSSPHGGVFELSQVGASEQVTGDVIKDVKTGKHYKKIPVSKPAYSLGHTTGAPVVSGVANRSTGRIGLGHAFPTEEQNRQHKAEKAARKSNNASGTRTPAAAAGSTAEHRTSMDVNTKEGRTQLFAQLRDLIHEEFEKANRGQTEELRKHVRQVNLEQQQHLQEHIEDVKEIINTDQPSQSEDGVQSEDSDLKASKDRYTTETAVATRDDDKRHAFGEKDSDGTLTMDHNGNAVRDPQPAERGFEGEDEDSDDEYEFPNKWAAIRYQLREPFAEFLGCFMLMVFGNGINCQVTVSQLYDASDPKGNYLSISFGWGVGVAMGVWVAGGISGGMINPAVTIALACFRKFSWKKVPIYIVAQILGCLMGSLCIYALYVNPIRIVDPGQTETTASLFTTYPAEFLRQPSTRMSAFYNEFFASAILLIVILAIGDSSNTPPPDGLAPLVLLWLVWGLGACLGWQTAYAVNPARDLGPRIMLSIVGYSSDILWTFNAWYWLWTPVIATCSGAIMGCIIYDTLCYTGGDSPINRKAKKHAPSLGPGSKQKMPAALSEA